MHSCKLSHELGMSGSLRNAWDSRKQLRNLLALVCCPYSTLGIEPKSPMRLGPSHDSGNIQERSTASVPSWYISNMPPHWCPPDCTSPTWCPPACLPPTGHLPFASSSASYLVFASYWASASVKPPSLPPAMPLPLTTPRPQHWLLWELSQSQELASSQSSTMTSPPCFALVPDIGPA